MARIALVFFAVATAFSLSAKEYPLERMAAPINTPTPELSPSLTADGKVLVFSRRVGRYQDLYISKMEGTKWTTPISLRSLNSPYNDEAPFISPDGTTIVFSSDRDGSLESRTRTGQIRVSFDLYWSHRDGGGRWSRPSKVPGTINTPLHERTPALSDDGSQLYYSVWPFGKKNMKYARVMVASLQRSAFSNPQPLPEAINSGHQEAGFRPARDRKGFYFSSLRPGGMGGWDVYFISYRDGKWGSVANLGAPVNSAAHDMHLASVGGRMYVCSNRGKNKKDFDIYSRKTQLEWIVRVIDKKTKKPLEADVRYQVAGEPNPLETKSGEDGIAEMMLDKDAIVKRLSVSREGYLPDLKENPKHSGREIVVELQPLEKAASFNVHAIRFDFDSAKIKRESRPYLDDLVSYLARNKTLKFLITGHTDLKGPSGYNMKLSLRRARAVRDYLVKKGLSKNRFKVKGAGETRPIGPHRDARNRRTEFTLLDR